MKTEIYKKENAFNSKNKKSFSQYSKKSFFNIEKNELLFLYKKMRDLTDIYDEMCRQRFSKLYELKYNGAKFENDSRWEIPSTNGLIIRVPEDKLLQELNNFEYAILEKTNKNESNNYSEFSSRSR